MTAPANGSATPWSPGSGGAHGQRLGGGQHGGGRGGSGDGELDVGVVGTVVMRVSLGVPTMRAASRCPLAPAVAWAKLMPSTTTSRGAAAGWPSRMASPGWRAARSIGPRLVGRSRTATSTGTRWNWSLSSAAARSRLARSRSETGGGRAGADQVGEQAGERHAQRDPEGALVDLQLEVGGDHHVGGAGDLGELGAVLDAADLGSNAAIELIE